MMRTTWLPNKIIIITLFILTSTLLLSKKTIAASEWETQSQPPGLTLHLKSQQTPVPLNQMHQWEIELISSQGTPVENADITVTGGMPEHDHGLATAPRVSGQPGEGKYLLEGLRFHMPGEWKLDFVIMIDNKRYQVEHSFSL